MVHTIVIFVSAILCPMISDQIGRINNVTGRMIGNGAFFSCASGYKLNGSSSLLCVEDSNPTDTVAEWNSMIPDCKGK